MGNNTGNAGESSVTFPIEFTAVPCVIPVVYRGGAPGTDQLFSTITAGTATKTQAMVYTRYHAANGSVVGAGEGGKWIAAGK